MKTKEELIELREKFESVTRKLAELTEEELAQVYGGLEFPKIEASGMENPCEPGFGSYGKEFGYEPVNESPDLKDPSVERPPDNDPDFKIVIFKHSPSGRTFDL